MEPDVYRKHASFFGAATAALGFLGLSGWILGMPLLASIRSSYIPMAPLTAIAFLCLGGLLLVHSMGSPQRPVALLAAIVSALLSAYGLIELVEYLGMPVLSLEERLFPDPPMVGAILTGRMSPTTAALLLLSGAVVPMLFLRGRGGERQRFFGDVAGCLGILSVVTGTVFVLSYLHGAPLLYGTLTIPMAATTALAYLLLGTGQILAVGPDGFPSRLFAGPSTRARLLRAFVSTTVGVVVAIDLLHVYAQGIFPERRRVFIRRFHHDTGRGNWCADRKGRLEGRRRHGPFRRNPQGSGGEAAGERGSLSGPCGAQPGTYLHARSGGSHPFREPLGCNGPGLCPG